MALLMPPGILLALLVNIMAVAVLSLPAPWRAFPDDPPNELVLHFPYVLIPALFVMAALAGHSLVFRKLAREARAAASGSRAWGAGVFIL